MHPRPKSAAPLTVNKDRSVTPPQHPSYQPRYYKLRQQQLQRQNQYHQYHHHVNITPPSSPGGASDDDTMEPSSRRIFHNYLRAFYPFHPSGDVSPSTVTLPLEQGDIILVHSVHTNGWADGTLLDTAARGWLPTNYCEAYDHVTMRPLLFALMDFWDTIRGGYSGSSPHFYKQDLVRGLIAGVRFLLVSLMFARGGIKRIYANIEN